MTQKIRTIKRTKDMPKNAKWVATDADGHRFSYVGPPSLAMYQWYGAGWQPLDSVRQPKDFRTTLRRIVDPPKKPKRKMTLAADNKRLRDVLRRLRDACMDADADGELSERVDGALLNEATIALTGRDGGVRWGPRRKGDK